MANEVNELAQSGPGLPQLDFASFPHQVFWLILTLVVLYILLSRVAIPRVSHILSERAGTIQRDLDDAESFKHKAQDIQAICQKAQVENQREVGHIHQQLREDIAEMTQKAIENADKDIEAKVHEAEKDIDAIKQQSIKTVKDIAIGTTSDIASAIMAGISLDQKDIKACVDEKMKMQ